jgi:hypothetical protein
LALVVAAAWHTTAAQTQYYNLDAARPGRIEDAEPTARYSLDIDPSSFQYERITGGTNRYRAEPRLAYGVLPFTELELRLPVVRVDPPHVSGARASTGVGGVGIGGMRSFNVETASLPALAVSGEWLAPAGSLAGPRGSYSLKALLTKTTVLGRWHLNAGGGTYSIRLTPRSTTDTSCSSLVTVHFAGDPCAVSPPIVIDAPCSVAPKQPAMLAPSRFCMPPAGRPDSTPTSPTSLAGRHWFGGVGYDRAFALRSTVVTADLFAERFVGLYNRPDLTAEAGLRHQVTPVVAVDAGAAWHFAGVLHSFGVTLGASYELATPPLFRLSR